MVFFSDIQYGPGSSCSTADLLKVASDRTARTLNRSVVIVVMIVVAVDILRLFDKAWHTSLLLKLKSYRFQGFSLMKNHLFRILDCVTLLEPWFALWSFSLLWFPFFSIYGNRVLTTQQKTLQLLIFLTPLSILKRFNLTASGDVKHENVNQMHKLVIQRNYHLNEINLNHRY